MIGANTAIGQTSSDVSILELTVSGLASATEQALLSHCRSCGGIGCIKETLYGMALLALTIDFDRFIEICVILLN